MATRTPATRAALTRVHEVVAAIPPGRVLTYGEAAELAGIPSGHRVAARAMRCCPEGLPWQRVVGKHDVRWARIAIGEPATAQLQRELLQHEGVVFDARGLISLRRFGWLPR